MDGVEHLHCARNISAESASAHIQILGAHVNMVQSLVTDQYGLARCGKKCTRLLVTASHWLTVVASAEEGGLERLRHGLHYRLPSLARCFPLGRSMHQEIR